MEAGTVNGQIQIASSGKGVANGVLTFTLSQPAVVSGTATIVTTPVNCYTDALGNVVGLPNPQVLPVLSNNPGSGSLPSGSYYVRYTWANSSGESVASPEAQRVTTQTGTLIVQTPANPPGNATQWKIYIGTAAGAETLQATQNAPFSNYSQSTPVVSGTSLPGTNSSVCSLRFNDELQPSYTGYVVNLTTASGAGVPGFPQKWYLSGGAAGTVNVSSGTPLYSGVVAYPQAVVTAPAANGQQSINGPLNLNGFGLTAGTVRAASLQATGPNPWWDVCQNGLACDGTTDDTAAFNSLLTTACTGGGGTLWIPPAKTVRFASAPNHIPCGLTLAGAYSRGSAFGFGSFIKCDYTESTATNACLWWDGANAATQGNGGGIRGINIQKGDGKTGGAAVKISGTDCTARAGNFHLSGVRISQGTGTWAYDTYVDGSACATAGTQGSRDNYFSDFDVFGGTTEAIHLDNCAHCYFDGLETSPSGANGSVNITGAGAGTAASTDVLITASQIGGNLTYGFSSSLACSACNVTGTVSISANNLSSTFDGIAGAVSNSGGTAIYATNQVSVQGPISATGTIQTTNGHIVSGADVGSPIAGDIVTDLAGFFGVSGRIFFGHNGNDTFTSSATNPTIRLGGNTASFPSWKRNGAAWNARLADDSADANVTAGAFTAATYTTATNCASSGGACGSAAAGRVTIAAAATTVTVATTAVTANSEILMQEDSTLGTALSVTCNATTGRTYTVTTRTAGTSFIVTASAAPAVNPACLSYKIVN